MVIRDYTDEQDGIQNQRVRPALSDV